MSKFKPHMEILPALQQELWPHLKPSVQLGLVLYGGTAIGLRLGHRPSIDFDFFTDKPLQRAVLDNAFPFLKSARVLQEEPNTLTLLASPRQTNGERVKISFFGNLDFGRIGEPELTEDSVLQIASLDDLMATKVKVLLQRVEAKDYTDIAAMIEAGVPIERGLAGAARMYGPAFQASESLKAMVFFEGGDLDLLTQREKRVLIQASQRVRELPNVTLIRRLSIAHEETA